jgi:hypothetical protein
VNWRGNGRWRLDETSVVVFSPCPSCELMADSAGAQRGCWRCSTHALGSNLGGGLMRAPRWSVGASRQPGQTASGVSGQLGELGPMKSV